ncbi:class B sortase [Butyrivibrio sp. XPD2002]|uniref:class B sortase n=1 Tax=Butyrivibrio sp. XPD2002 TaxID=1280665 RepID=UPI0012DD3B91|nr:class B sortase [Butyrivibrio sp. XPD2002]
MKNIIVLVAALIIAIVGAFIWKFKVIAPDNQPVAVTENIEPETVASNDVEVSADENEAPEANEPETTEVDEPEEDIPEEEPKAEEEQTKEAFAGDVEGNTGDKANAGNTEEETTAAVSDNNAEADEAEETVEAVENTDSEQENDVADAEPENKDEEATENSEEDNSSDNSSDDNKLYAMDEYLEKLKNEYHDAVGWLYFEDGSISYPIMQGEDNEKYLTYGYDGNPADTGAIFLDYRSAADFSDSNSIVYGHNMKNRTMFGTLRNFRYDKNYYNDHQYFYIITEDNLYKYEIFAYMDVPNDYVIYDYVGEKSKEFVADAEPVRLKSYMDSEIPVNESKKVVTLSTCTSKDQLRFVVLGVLVD